MSNCSIPNGAIKAVASKMGKHPEEVNAMCDVINDMIGSDFDIATEITDIDVLKGFVSSVSNLFKDKDKSASNALKTAITKEITNNPNINPLSIISKIAEAYANKRVKQEKAKTKIFESHNHKASESVEGEWSQKESISDFMEAFTNGEKETTLEELLENVIGLDERFSSNGVFDGIIKLISAKGLGGMKVRFLKPSESVEFARNKNIKGSYKPDRREIHINAGHSFKYGVNDQGYRYSEIVTSIFHEAVHAITHDIMMANNCEYYTMAKELLSDIKKSAAELGIDITDYGFTSPEEMLSELMNGSFVDKLNRITMSKNIKSAYELDKRVSFVEKVIRAIKNFFSNLFSSRETAAYNHVANLFKEITNLDIADMNIMVGDNASLYQIKNLDESKYTDEQFNETLQQLESIDNYKPGSINLGKVLIDQLQKNATGLKPETVKKVGRAILREFYVNSNEYSNMTFEQFTEKAKTFGKPGNPWPMIMNQGMKNSRQLLNLAGFESVMAKIFEKYVDEKGDAPLRASEFFEKANEYKDKYFGKVEQQKPQIEIKTINDLFLANGPYVKQFDTLERLINKKVVYKVGENLYANKIVDGSKGNIGSLDEGKLFLLAPGPNGNNTVYCLENYYERIKEKFGAKEADNFRENVRKQYKIDYDAKNGNNKAKTNLENNAEASIEKTFREAEETSDKITAVVYHKIKRNDNGEYSGDGVIVRTDLGAHQDSVKSNIKSVSDAVVKNGGNPVDARIEFSTEHEQMKCLYTVTPNSEVYIDMNNGSTLKFDVSDVPLTDTQQGKVAFVGKASLVKTINYDLASANAFLNIQSVLGSEQGGETTIEWDYYQKIKAVKMKIGYDKYDNRRNLIASSFINQLNGYFKKKYIESIESKIRENDDNYLKANLEIKRRNIKPIDILQSFRTSDIFQKVKNDYLAMIADESKNTKTAIARKQELSKLVEDGTWEVICSDVLDIISEKLEVSLVDEVGARAKTMEEIADSNYENGSEEFNVEAFEEKSLESWQESAGNKSKHSSLTVELKHFLESIPMYENGKPKKDDLGIPIMLSANEAFVFLQNKLHDYQTIEEMEDALADIILSRPQYKGLYEEIRIKDDGNGHLLCKNYNMRAAFFRGMRSQFKNIFVSKKNVKTKVGTDENGASYTYTQETESSWQINRSSARLAMIEQTTTNIASGEQMAKAYSVYTKDGKLSKANRGRLLGEITAFINATEEGMLNRTSGGNVNLFKDKTRKGTSQFYERIKYYAKNTELGNEILRKAVKDKVVEISVKGENGKKEKKPIDVGARKGDGSLIYPELNMLKEFYDIINDSLAKIGVEITEDEIFDMFFDRRCKIAGGEGSLLYCIKDYLEWLNQFEDRVDMPIETKEYKNHMNRIIGCISTVGKGQVEQSKFENGKTVNSVTNPSWESTNINNLTNPDKEKRKAYIDTEYNNYQFFKSKGNEDEIAAIADKVYKLYSTLPTEQQRTFSNKFFVSEATESTNYEKYAESVNLAIAQLKALGYSETLKRMNIQDTYEYKGSIRYNSLLRELEDDDKVAANCMLYNINNSHGKEYNDWSAAENAAEMMLQYMKELYDDNGEPKDNAYYVGIPNPVLADAPTAEYYRIKRRYAEKGDNAVNDFDTMDNKLSEETKNIYAMDAFGKPFEELTNLQRNRLVCYVEMMNIVKQETNRISVVLARDANRTKAKEEWEKQYKEVIKKDKERFEAEMSAYMNLSPEQRENVEVPAPVKEYPTYKDIINPETNEPYWTEPDANYDISRKDGKIKNIGGAEYKFFPAMNNFRDGKSLYDIIQDINNNKIAADIDRLVFKKIVEVQREEFENAYRNWKNDGLFRLQKNYETGEFEFKFFGKNAPNTLKSEYYDIINSEKFKKQFDNIAKTPEEKEEMLEEAEERLANQKLGVTEESMEVLMEYFDQSVLGIANIAQMNTTDFAYYKNPNDFQKRYKEVYAPSERLCTSIPFFGREFEKTFYFKDVKMPSNNEMLNSIDKILTKTGMEKRQVSEILDSFRGTNVADAQAYRSLKSYRSVKAMSGDLPLEGKVILSRLIGDLWIKDESGKIKEVNGRPVVDPNILNEDEIKQCDADGITLEPYPDVENIKDADKRKEAMEKMSKMIASDSMYVCQTIKPFTYAQIGMKSGVKGYGNIKIGVQHKNSEFAMLWATEIGRRYAKVLGLDNDSGIKMLIGLSEFMDKHDIDVVQFHSAVKVGCYGTVDVMDCYEDKVDENGNKTGDKVFKYKDSKDFVDFLEHQIFAPNTDGSGIDTTKPREGMIKTVPYSCYGIQASTPEHLIDIEQLVGSQIRRLILADNNANTPFVINGKKYTRQQLVDHYNALITENVLETMRGLDKMFSSPEEIERLLIREMQSNAQYTPDMMKAARLVTLPDGRKVFPLLADPVVSKKIESLLNSIIRSRVTKQKIKGGACIQVSCFGCEDLKVVWSKPDADGIKHPLEMECYMGAYMKDLIEPALNSDGVLDLRELRKNVDKDTYWAITHAIGYRVPTEDKYSMARLKIKGFLPPMNGSAIMLPKEITTLSGSDFDVDKMYLMLHEFKKDIIVKLDTPAKTGSILRYVNDILNGNNSEAYSQVIEKFSEREKELIGSNSMRELLGAIDAFVNKSSDDATQTDFNKYIKSLKNGEIKKQLATARGIVKKFVKWATKNESSDILAKDFVSTLKSFDIKTLNTVKVIKYKEDDIVNTNTTEEKTVEEPNVPIDYTDVEDDDLLEMSEEDFDGITSDEQKAEQDNKDKQQRLRFGDEAAKNSRAARNNRMIDVMLSVMAHPDTSSKFLNPGSFDTQKKTARMIELMNTGWNEISAALGRMGASTQENKYIDIQKSIVSNNGKNLYTELSKLSLDELSDLTKNLAKTINPISPYTQVYFHNQNEIGEKLIGAYANHNAAHAAAQYYKLSIYPDAAFMLFEGKGKIERLDSTDPRISKNNAGFLAASVDNVKDPVLYWLNQNLYTADVSMLLSRAGVTSDEIGILMNQPVIKKAVEMYNDAGFGSKEASFIKTIKEMFEGTGTFAKYQLAGLNNKKLKERLEVLVNEFKNETLNIDTLASQLGGSPDEFMQFKVAIKFLHMLKVGQDLSSLTQCTKTDTQNGAAKSTMAENIVKLRKTQRIKDNVDGFTLNFDHSVFGPQMGEHFYDSNGNLNKDAYNATRDSIYDCPYSMLSAFSACGVSSTSLLFKDIFPWYQSPFIKMIDDLERMKGSAVNADDVTLAFNDFMNYWMSSLESFGQNGDLSAQDRRKMYVENFSDYFLDIKSKYPEVANNPFIKALQFKYVDTVTNKNIKPEDIKNKKSWNGRVAKLLVLPNVGRIDDKRKQNLISSWEALFASENDEVRRLAENLLIYSYFRNGLGFSPDSFGHLAPLFRTELSGYMQNMIELIDNDGEVGNSSFLRKERLCRNFLTQFVQNHPNEHLVEQINKWDLGKTLYKSYDFVSKKLGISNYPKTGVVRKKDGGEYYKMSKAIPEIILVDESDIDAKSESPLYWFDKKLKMYKPKPVVKIENEMYAYINMKGIGCFYKLNELGMANKTEGEQFLEYDISSDTGLLSIFKDNNKNLGTVRTANNNKVQSKGVLRYLDEIYDALDELDYTTSPIPSKILAETIGENVLNNNTPSTFKQPNEVGTSDEFRAFKDAFQKSMDKSSEEITGIC